MSWIVKDLNKGTTREVDSRSKAEEKKSNLEALGAEIEIIPPSEDVEPEVVDQTDETVADGGSMETQAVAESHDQPTPEELENDPDIITSVEDLEQTEEAIDQLGESLGTDPLSILPSHMVDTIQGQPAVNKRGYAMIAERYGIEVSATIEQFPWDNDEGRCVARATAVTEDGREYSGWATAAAEDGDMADQIIELAETRALKRAVSWASGVGIVSYQEMVGELE